VRCWASPVDLGRDVMVMVLGLGLVSNTGSRCNKHSNAIKPAVAEKQNSPDPDPRFQFT